jgi:hypothetical protein
MRSMRAIPAAFASHLPLCRAAGAHANAPVRATKTIKTKTI